MEKIRIYKYVTERGVEEISLRDVRDILSSNFKDVDAALDYLHSDGEVSTTFGKIRVIEFSDEQDIKINGRLFVVKLSKEDDGLKIEKVYVKVGYGILWPIDTRGFTENHWKIIWRELGFLGVA